MISLLIKAQIIHHLDLLKLAELLMVLEDQTQTLTEKLLMQMLLKLLLLLLLNTVVRIQELPLILLPWLPNINKPMTRMLPLEPSTSTTMLRTK
tara:strand:+ start:235 stop:516 length:282 start_codon:yes stop_codon:yes gene_type:complete